MPGTSAETNMCARYGGGILASHFSQDVLENEKTRIRIAVYRRGFSLRGLITAHDW